MLGVHFALSAAQEQRLLAAGDDQDAVEEMLADLEESGAAELSVDTDKAWDALHRCFGDGTLDPDGGDYPLTQAFLGGRHLSDDYYAVYVTAGEVRDVAAALEQVDEADLRRRFDAMDTSDYAGAHDAADFAYTWENFVDVRVFFAQAAAARLAVVFTAT